MVTKRWIVESGRVLSSEEGALWVAADKSGACGNCSAKVGCGTSLLASFFTPKGDHEIVVRALLSAELREQTFTPGQMVELAIDKNAFVKIALVSYLVPLTGLLAGVILAARNIEVLVVFAALAGLFLGGWLASRILRNWRNNELMQPIVLRRCISADHSVVQVR
jgi:sigma-E factor negative regulatory protein RseC